MSTGRWGHVGAGVLLLARDTRRVLLLHRSHWVREPGTWGLAGGKVEEYELPEEGAIREMGEEIGFVGPLALVEALVFRDGSFRFHNYIGIVEHEFEPELNEENDYAAWFKIGAWPEPLHFGVEALLTSLPPGWERSVLR